MAATVKNGISVVREANSHRAHFVNEDLISIPAAKIRDEFRKLSRFLPVIVLIPKSAVHDETAENKPAPNKSVVGLKDARDVPSPLDAAKAWFKNKNSTDLFVFGEVTVNSPTMEIHRKGRPLWQLLGIADLVMAVSVGTNAGLIDPQGPTMAPIGGT